MEQLVFIRPPGTCAAPRAQDAATLDATHLVGLEQTRLSFHRPKLDKCSLHIFRRRLLSHLDQVLLSYFLGLFFQLLALAVYLLYLLALFVIAMLFELLLTSSELLAFFSDFFDLLEQLVGVEGRQTEVDVNYVREIFFRAIFQFVDYRFLVPDDLHDVVFQLKAELGEAHGFVAFDALDTDREVGRFNVLLVNQTLFFFRIVVNPNCIDYKR